jgi:4-hydroxy-4-methyl-2-oxoglutarate aldolase
MSVTNHRCGDEVVDRFATLYSAVVADVLDELGHRNATMRPGLVGVSTDGTLAGRAATLRVVAVDAVPADPYRVQFEAVDALKAGEVMVVAAPDVASAFWGELISTRAAVKGCLGAVVDGYCRDVAAIRRRGFPVWARGTHPADSSGRLDAVEYGATIQCSGVTVRAGDVIVADADGVTVVPQALAGEVLELAERKARTEDEVRQVLRDGATIEDTYDRYGVM